MVLASFAADSLSLGVHWIYNTNVIDKKFGRIAPLIYVYHNDPEALIDSAKAQTAFTHNNPQVIESALFFSTVALKVLEGDAPKAAILQVKEEQLVKAPILKWIEKGLDSVEQESRQAIFNFGQMCETAAAFPGVIHLIVKYENDLKTALVKNIMAGGDSAGSSLLVGLVLGAHLGIEAIPQNWLTEMKAYQQIVDRLKKIDNTGLHSF